MRQPILRFFSQSRPVRMSVPGWSILSPIKSTASFSGPDYTPLLNACCRRVHAPIGLHRDCERNRWVEQSSSLMVTGQQQSTAPYYHRALIVLNRRFLPNSAEDAARRWAPCVALALPSKKAAPYGTAFLRGRELRGTLLLHVCTAKVTFLRCFAAVKSPKYLRKYHDTGIAFRALRSKGFRRFCPLPRNAINHVHGTLSFTANNT